MADVYVGSAIDWGLMIKSIPDRDSFKAYAERVRARDGYQAAKAIDTALIAEMQAQPS
jgi:glutathione S-transferase